MATSNDSNVSTRALVIVGIIALIVIIALAALTAPDRRTTGERVSDAVDQLPNVNNAARELEDRTPAERVGDAVEEGVEETQETIRRATDTDNQ